MKKIVMVFLVCSSYTFYGQKDNVPTDSFTVTGQIEKELTFTIADIEKLASKPIGKVAITNHLGEPRGTAKKLKGVLVKNLLKDMVLNEKSPKRFSAFYLTFVAVDNYTVVYSWNEIFNSSTGDNLFVITSQNGVSIRNMEDRILILTPTDFKTGRRHIKGLKQIQIDRADK